MVAYVDEALEAGAVGVSSGLIYAPGMHARPDEVAALVAAAARRGRAVRHAHAQRGGRGARRDRRGDLDRPGGGRAGRRPARLQVSHLKAGARSMWGDGGRAGRSPRCGPARRPRRAADQYPYTAAATTLATVLPPAILALPTDETVAAIRDAATRASIRDEQARGVSGWENVHGGPGLGGDRDRAQRVATRVGRALARGPRGRRSGATRPTSRSTSSPTTGSSVDVVIHCMAEPDVETIMRVPWIAVCTDAEGRRAGHPILDAGRAPPADLRVDGARARRLRARPRVIVDLETAVAKLSAVPAARVGLRDRGVAPRGRLRRRRGLRPRDRGRPRHLRSAGRPPGGDPGRDRERPSGGARRPRDRRAPGSTPPARRLRRPSAVSSSAAQVAVETDAVVRLPGGDLPYVLRRSPRSRGCG